MYTSLCAVTVSQLRVGTELGSGKKVKADSNGIAPYIFNVIAGKCPNRNIKAGTIVENSGFENGKSYLIQVRETETDPQYGRQFQFTKVSELTGLEVIKAVGELGNAEVWAVDIAEVAKEQSKEQKAAPMLK